MLTKPAVYFQVSPVSQDSQAEVVVAGAGTQLMIELMKPGRRLNNNHTLPGARWTGDTGGAHTSRLHCCNWTVFLNGITKKPKMLLHVTCAYFAKEHGRSCLEVTHPSSELRTSFTRWALRHLPFSPRLLGQLKNMVQFNLSCH